MIKNKSEQTGIVNRWLPLAAFLTTRCTHNWTRHYRATPTSVTKPAGHGFPGRGSPGNTSSAASKTNKMNIYPKKYLNFTFSYRNISFVVKFKTNTVGRNAPLYFLPNKSCFSNGCKLCTFLCDNISIQSFTFLLAMWNQSWMGISQHRAIIC